MMLPPGILAGATAMRHDSIRIWLAAGFAAVLARPVTPAEIWKPGGESLDDLARDYRWEEAAQKAGLGDEDVKQLGRDKVLVGRETFRQIFSPYIESECPVFITSDSLLNAYHVLFEESVRGLEKSRARVLPEILNILWTRLAAADIGPAGIPEQTSAARTRAQVVLGTALALLEDRSVTFEGTIADLINAEARKVAEGKAVEKPGWLGKPDDGFLALDYTRFKPRGFYASSPDLQRYFRAVSWLQAIPFRVRNDEELLSILLIGEAARSGLFDIRGSLVRREIYETFFRGFSDWIAPQDDLGLAYFQYDRLPKELTEIRAKILNECASRAGLPGINNQIRLPLADPKAVAEVTFRVLPAHWTPDGALFQRTTDTRAFQRPFPSGLEVAAALGSGAARSALSAASEGDRVLKVVEECGVLFKGSTLYQDYLDCLRALLDKPEPDAPPFLSGRPWEIKSCQTVLGGWALLRHTWVLQAKRDAVYGCMMPPLPPGFVEPEPEFFSRLARLVRRTQAMLGAADAFTVVPANKATRLREWIRLARQKGYDKKKVGLFINKLAEDEEKLLLEVWGFVLYAEEEAEKRPERAGPPDVLGRLEALADRLDKVGEIEMLVGSGVVRYPESFCKPSWDHLNTLCLRVEALAHKQLRAAPLSKEERRFVLDYGRMLADAMFYWGNSYVSPNDDAPRIADVMHNPNANACLEAGVGRPRALYVLYPYKGVEILCRGAVMSYYEFSRPDPPLTDAEWKDLLDSKDGPAQPGWLRPILSRHPPAPPRTQ
jgi:hypothetical protein